MLYLFVVKAKSGGGRRIKNLYVDLDSARSASSALKTAAIAKKRMETIECSGRNSSRKIQRFQAFAGLNAGLFVYL